MTTAGTSDSHCEKNQTPLQKALAISKKNTPDSEYEAIPEFEKICYSTTATDEEKIEAWQCLGCCYYKVKNYHAAISAFDKAIGFKEVTPATVYAHLYKGDALLKIRKYGKAREEFYQTLTILKKPKLQNILGQQNRQQQSSTHPDVKVQTAGQQPESQQKSSSHSLKELEWIYLEASVLQQIGISLSQTDNDEEAIDYFNQAFSLADSVIDESKKVDPYGISSQKIEKIFHTSRINKSLSLCRTDRVEEARKLITLTISDLEGPHNEPYKKYRIGAQNVLGVTYLADSREENSGSKAVEAFNKSIEIARELPESEQRLYLWKGYYNKGLALKIHQEYAKAIACFTEGLKECGEFEPHLLYGRGVTKIELQNYDDGIQDLQEVNQFDPRYSPALATLGDAYRQQNVYYREVELQKQLLESSKESVSTTQRNLKELSNEMRKSMKHVSWMFYLLFITGVFAFLSLPIIALLRYPSSIDPINVVIGMVGGIDVILSMMFLSPTKIQKNRIDYSQWLMGYFNWINTQFAATTVMLERLQKVHSPAKSTEDEFNWDYAKPVYTFLNTMTKDTLETIDKCCEFPDVQYSLSKKTESKTGDQATKPGDAGEEQKTPETKPADSGKAETNGAASPAEQEGSNGAIKAGSLQSPLIPEGFEYIGTGDKIIPGHIIEGTDPDKEIPAVVISCWKKAATDNTRRIGISAVSGEKIIEIGTKPEPLARPFTVDEFSKKINVFFAIVGYRDIHVLIGIRFMYLDETGSFSTLPNNENYIKVKKKDGKETKTMYFVRHSDEIIMRQQVFGHGDKQVLIDYFELPGDHPIDQALGKHYITFRIAESFGGASDYIVKDGVKVKRKIEWLWESDLFEYTIDEKKET